MTELHCRHLKADIDQYVESIEEKMADNREVKTEDIVSHFDFTATTARRYLRQLTEFGYLEARGGNRNRTYVPREFGDLS